MRSDPSLREIAIFGEASLDTSRRTRDYSKSTGSRTAFTLPVFLIRKACQNDLVIAGLARPHSSSR